VKPEVFTYTKTVEVPLVDADGVPIRLGSVLEQLDGSFCGVVVRIARAGMRGRLCECVGDISVWNGGGSTTVSSRYSNWRHVPHDKQKHWQRFESWILEDDWIDPDSRVGKDVQIAVYGIMRLIPENHFNFDWSGYPLTTEDALRYLALYMDKMKEAKA
jgi:hypothetical protein